MGMIKLLFIFFSPFYIGLRRNRVTGPEYDTLLDNFMKACRKKFVFFF